MEAVRLLRTPRIDHLHMFPHVKPTDREQVVLDFLNRPDVARLVQSDSEVR